MPRKPIRRSPTPQPQVSSPPSRVALDRDAFRIAGLPAVRALFAKRPEAVERLYLDERLKGETEELCRQLARLHRPYRFVEAEELGRIGGSPLHGGILAITRPPVVPAFDTEEAKLWAASGDPLVFLDGVGNPHNLGAIVRTLAFFGMPRLVISDSPDQAGPSESAWRVSEGGMEYVGIWRAVRLPIALKRLKDHFRVVGTALGQGRVLRPQDLHRRGPRPIALVLGNEEHGLSSATLQACEKVVTLSGAGNIQSMNVAATAAILAFQMSQD
ncbi:MAG: RNA methyltransferase [Magnetospirillum sp. WYHS-4]